MTNPFTQHPKEVNETYWAHCCFAEKAAFTLLAAGLVSMVHGIFPFLFKGTASNMMKSLHQRMEQRNQQR